jgi:hypothetical protein
MVPASLSGFYLIGVRYFGRFGWQVKGITTWRDTER